MKFLVIWQLGLALLSPYAASAVARMPAYAKPLEQTGAIHGAQAAPDARLAANEELERLIALMPVYNFRAFRRS